MRKVITLTVAMLLLYSSAAAVGPRLGAGVYGGLDIPIIQDDQAQGTIFGIRGKIKALPIVTVEPRISFTSFGGPDYEDFDLDMEGSKVTSYGVDAAFGAPFGATGFNLFGVLGAGFYKVKRDQTNQDETNLGWSAGLGLAIGLAPMVSVEARGMLHVIPYDEGGSAKSVSATAGLNYYFGM
ncbi:MAG: outer membrane beta-barrel protein [Candidatus Zixiibacteriota bacterium]|nr:MAG: outer membrane beta-barrel protein [candidate division Zixibacteria bacterium]